MKKFLYRAFKFFIIEFGLSALTTVFDFIIAISYVIGLQPGYRFLFSESFQAMNVAFRGPIIPVSLFFITSTLQLYGVCAERFLFAKIGTGIGAVLWIFLTGIFQQWMIYHPATITSSLELAVMMTYSYIMLFFRYMAGWRVFYRIDHVKDKEIPSIDR